MSVSLPMEPAQRIILAVRIIIALLRTPHLIAHQQHGNTLRQGQHAQKIALLNQSGMQDRELIAGPFHTVITTVIIMTPVTIILTVGVVMLVLIAHQVLKGETIMSSDKIDRCVASILFLKMSVIGGYELAGKFL